MKITRCLPNVALAGGIVRLEVESLSKPLDLNVSIGGIDAEIVGAAPDFVTIRIPETSSGEILLHSDGHEANSVIRLGRLLADELHCVANPVVDASGNIYVTLSGSRGESVPFGVFIVTPDGTKEPFLGDITNPTGLAIGPDQLIYISSRHSGTVYRSTFDKQIEKYAEGLGIATGLVFDSKGNLLVGDRSGSIYRVSPEREVSVYCELEASVSAYHLAIDSADRLFVTGPTLATQDTVYRVDSAGKVEPFFKGFGRPQGLAFDRSDTLNLVGSYRGRKGVFHVFEDREPERIVASPMLVGLAYARSGKLLFLTDGPRLFSVEV
jgi:sugar lactone lactonase YvrE